MKSKTKFIVNPAAGNRAFSRKRTEFERHAKAVQDASVDLTEEAGHAGLLATQALNDGYDTIVAVGGDGTVHDVANGWFEKGVAINPEARLGIIGIGTGGDFLKTLSLATDFEQAFAALASNRTRKCDIGRMTCDSIQGSRHQRYFVNIADAGFGGKLVQSANNSTKALGPFFAYLTALLRTLSVYKSAPVRIEIDGIAQPEQNALAVVIANGQYFGGGMWIAPQAQPDDGLFDIVIIGDISKPDVLANIHKLYNGTITSHEKVTIVRGRRISIAADCDVLIDADGEFAGKLPATFEISPGQISVLC